jgi:hypothetical protein
MMVEAKAANGSVVSIFGNSRCSPQDEEYRQAEILGGLLAAAGFTVCTGGYAGVMEAASRAAREAGGEVIGITVDIFSDPPNNFLSREIRTETLHRRLEVVSQMSDGFIALNGGIGTIAEVALIWNLLTTKSINPARPFILLGRPWENMIQAFTKHLAFRAKDLTYATVVATAAEAVSELTLHLQRV